VSQTDTIVIGGGISGLVTAYYLRKLGQSVILFESRSRVGGVLQRATVEGINLELGANSFLLKDESLGLLEELKIQIIEASASDRFLCLETKNGPKLFKAPSSLGQFFTTGMLSPLGKIRILFEQVVGRITEDLSVHDFLSKRFGKEFSKIAETALNGIYAADTTQLSARSALPSLWQLQERYGSVIGGFLFGKKTGRKSKPKIVSFTNGMQSLPQAFSDSLSTVIKLNCQVVEIIPGTGVRLASGEIFNSKNIVIATDSVPAASFIESFCPSLSQKLRSIPYVPLGMLYVTGDKNDLKESVEGLGFLKQPKKGNSLLGALYSSSLFPIQTGVDKNQALLTCFVGGALNPEMSDVTKEQNASHAFQELKQTLGLGPSFRVLHAHFWAKAIPSYPIGHYQLTTEIQELEKEQIFVVANWLERPGLPDCIIRAKEIAQRIVN
jgi:oxygen-dependent protoporphyrinogen oxidase